jgi:tetratricopeptide (TPR) repeat protein
MVSYGLMAILLLAGTHQVKPLATYLDEARALLARDSVKSAVDLLQEAVTTYPDNADAHLLLGSALALVPRRDESISELTRAVELAPNSAVFHNVLGTAWARFAEYDRARAEFEKAVTIDPGFLDARLSLTLILAERNETDRAKNQIDQALQICRNCSKSAYLHLLQGRILASQGTLDQAAVAFESAIRLKPGYTDAYLELGLLKVKMSDQIGGVRALKKAVEFDPGNPEARYRLGSEYLSSKRPNEAVEQLREAYRLRPEDRRILYAFARGLRACGKTEESDLLMRKLASDLKSSSQASERAAQTAALNDEGIQLEKSGRISAAADRYRAALENDPLADTVRRNLGLALCRLGRWDEGIAELREALRLNPDDAETARALYIALDQASAAGH